MEPGSRQAAILAMSCGDTELDSMLRCTCGWLRVSVAQALFCGGAPAAAALLDWALEGQLIPRLLKCLHDSATLVHSHGLGEFLVLKAHGILRVPAARRPGKQQQGGICCVLPDVCRPHVAEMVPCHAGHGRGQVNLPCPSAAVDVPCCSLAADLILRSHAQGSLWNEHVFHSLISPCGSPWWVLAIIACARFRFSQPRPGRCACHIAAVLLPAAQTSSSASC